MPSFSEPFASVTHGLQGLNRLFFFSSPFQLLNSSMSTCGSGSGATRRQLVTVSLYTEKFVVMHYAYLTVKVIRVTVCAAESDQRPSFPRIW